MADVVVQNVFRTASESVGNDGEAKASEKGAGRSTDRGKKPSWVGWSKSRLLNTLRLVNCCNGVCLTVVAIISFLVPVATVSPSFETITISAYTVFLGLMMSCVELNMGLLQSRIRANCGFMFSFTGRCLFILFCSSMAFAMGGSTSWLCWLVGGLTACNGVFNGIVIVTHPAFRSGELSASDDPWARSRKAEEAVGAYLTSRPELILKAVAAVGHAQAAAAGRKAPATPEGAQAQAARARGGSSYGGSDASSASVSTSPTSSSSSSAASTSVVPNPYALALAHGSHGPGTAGVSGDAGGGYGYSEVHVQQRQGYQGPGPVHPTPGRGGTIRVQTVTQSITQTVVEYTGPSEFDPVMVGITGGGGGGFGAGQPLFTPPPAAIPKPPPPPPQMQAPLPQPAYSAAFVPGTAPAPPPPTADDYADNPFR